MTELVSGRDVLRQARELYGHYQEIVQPREQKVAIIRFTPAPTDPADWQIRLEASRVSAEQKVKAFEHLGFQADHVILPPGVGRAEFAAVLDHYSQDAATRSIIVQFPPPPELAPLVARMDPAKDIDALLKDRSPYAACATAEGIYRVAEPFAQDKPSIAVVGSNGFVGQGVVGLLRENGHDPMTLDYGDDLRQVRDADIVISVTGNPGILGPDHIQPHHRVVIDSGFVPQADGSVRGDIRPEAAGIPQNITPVPGGIGPVEMATLMERVVRQEVDPNVTPWKVTPGPFLDRTEFAAAATAASAPTANAPASNAPAATSPTAPGQVSVATAARLRGGGAPPAVPGVPAGPPRIPGQQPAPARPQQPQQPQQGNGQTR
ncbi:bifunctional 5,10-methylenetetrahydrofolate dehydrogenase/5,10-methenyltetrahydrofolate cyclohydrolase [Streptomyces sp. NBC_00249]|uniref:tetrahydrofolate dehydrogenase/cyclohydrolase catalytic domain-containing protein n=1 Tax=Streptomyces sp. NBC_00249 TaxID=2975690 RepID=UPI0022554C61|nr:tetrahydrofolate dehydrogenase/cyclohydrolase catalytic domain-containing protein [Streptomyces sp. NBC_00249]MCX5195022.1 bifunctional 5,10-methylenetetrahydrofolate dehydrogenase/5,10-methenyltetrahydrofolate cyclohydrolase [Streptomyces sp. NBC_00249]